MWAVSWARCDRTATAVLPGDGGQCADDVSISAPNFPNFPRCSWPRCPTCGGKGKQIHRQCHLCRGQKTLDTQHTLAVHIPAGAPEGYEEVFHGEADEGVDWEAGDVVVRVRSQRQEGQGAWARKESGLVGRVTLSVAEVSCSMCVSLARVAHE